MFKNTRKKIMHITRKLGLDKKMNDKIRKINDKFIEKTLGVDEFWDLSDFIELLELAEYDNLGKSKAIMYALKIGWISGKQDISRNILEHFSKKTYL